MGYPSAPKWLPKDTPLPGFWKSKSVQGDIFKNQKCPWEWIHLNSVKSSLSACLPVCLSICCLPACRSAWLSVCLSVCLSVFQSAILPACLSVYLSVCLSVCVYACLSLCLSVCLWMSVSECMSLNVSLWMSVSECLSVCLFYTMFLGQNCPWDLALSKKTLPHLPPFSEPCPLHSSTS